MDIARAPCQAEAMPRDVPHPKPPREPAPPADNPKAFKHWFSPALVAELGATLARLDRRFDRAAFDAHVTPLPRLELKARVQLVADALAAAIPHPFPKAAALLVRALPPAERRAEDGAWLLAWPLSRFVGARGIDHPDAALAALHALTQRFTGEFDIRPYLLHHAAQTLRTLHAWTRDPSEHVRRLVSEGTRTRLPWGLRLQPFIDDPSPVLPLLDALHADPSEYVRRSVANNLNDLAKDHPGLVVDIVHRWSAAGDAHHGALARRALRTLIKAGHPGALAELGAGGPVDTVYFVAPERVVIGTHLALEATLHNPGTTAARVVVDFAVTYRSKNARGEDTVRAPKVFKWKTLELAPGARVTLAKRHPMRPASIRPLHPGEHEVALQVNGARTASARFDLVADATPQEKRSGHHAR